MSPELNIDAVGRGRLAERASNTIWTSAAFGLSAVSTASSTALAATPAPTAARRSAESGSRRSSSARAALRAELDWTACSSISTKSL